MARTGTNADIPNSTLESNRPGRTPETTQVLGSLQLAFITLGLWISLFLCSLETTIISTSLIRISNDLNDQVHAGWIVVTYLLTFNACILVWSKLSDIFGNKWLLLSANLIFCIFSITCAGSKTMVQLVIFRAFQGIGGSGIYSLVFVIMAQIVPVEKLGLCTGILGSVFALASLLGPVLGGVISDNSTWRWVFWLNVPGTAVAVGILTKFMPGTKSKERVRRSLRNFDITGSFLSLAWAASLLFALQEGGNGFPWNSGVIIGTLAGGIAMLLAFCFWELWIHCHTVNEGLFPVALLKRSVVVFLFLSLVLVGFTFYIPIIQIPQRFQRVNFTTATRAGILVLPLTLVSPAAALAAGAVLARHRFWPPGLTVMGACLNLVGISLMGTLPVESDIPVAQFGYQTLIGFSLGLMTPSLLYLLRVEIEEKDIAGGMGVGNMCRTLGGCIGLAICGSASKAVLDKDLVTFLTPQQMEAIYASSSSAMTLLSDEQRARVGEAYGEAFNLQFKVLTAFSGLNIIITTLLWICHARSIGSKKQEERSVEGGETSTKLTGG